MAFIVFAIFMHHISHYSIKIFLQINFHFKPQTWEIKNGIIFHKCQ